NLAGRNGLAPTWLPLRMVPSLRRRRVRVSAWGLMTCSSHVTASPLAPSSQAVSLVNLSPVMVRRTVTVLAVTLTTSHTRVSVTSDSLRKSPALTSAKVSRYLKLSAQVPPVRPVLMVMVAGAVVLLMVSSLGTLPGASPRAVPQVYTIAGGKAKLAPQRASTPIFRL